MDLVLLLPLPLGAVGSAEVGGGFSREEEASGGLDGSFPAGLPKVELQIESPVPHVEVKESDDC